MCFLFHDSQNNRRLVRLWLGVWVVRGGVGLTSGSWRGSQAGGSSLVRVALVPSLTLHPGMPIPFFFLLLLIFKPLSLLFLAIPVPAGSDIKDVTERLCASYQKDWQVWLLTADAEAVKRPNWMRSLLSLVIRFYPSPGKVNAQPSL